YSLPSGQKIEAIAINPSMANLVFPPSNTLIEELECHIYYPEIAGKTIVGGANWKLSWLILFKQWDLKKTTILAAEKFVATCPYPVTNVFRNPPNTNINQPEVCRIKITCSSIIC
ncbi:MAG: hypothetical protein F6K35_47875, partial [Okeania sp. SIO2H7]|nr:hypothetical protein [Okeania sp. SIO2H7]